MTQGINYTIDNNKVLNFIKWLKGEKVEKKDDKKKRNEDEDDEWDPDLNTNIDKDLDMSKDQDKTEKSKAETDEDGYMAFLRTSFSQGEIAFFPYDGGEKILIDGWIE